jgi:four helix bundle protein
MKCETLDVWKRSARLSASIYKYFMEFKDYGFKDQITRAGLSVPSNIAEGMEKDYVKENIRFIEIARGSLAELATQVYIGMDIQYIEQDVGKDWVSESEEIFKMLAGLKKNLKNKE